MRARLRRVFTALRVRPAQAAVARARCNDHSHRMNRARANRIVLLTILSLLPAFIFAAEPLTRIRFSSSRDRVMVPVSLNGSNELSFLLDTGYGITMIHPDLAEPLRLRRIG